MSCGYVLGLAIAWTARCVIITGLLAIVAIQTGCSHELKSTVDSNGNWKQFPKESIPAN